ncbi:hypothetical protein PGB90_003261 [Kerria lacca]
MRETVEIFVKLWTLLLLFFLLGLILPTHQKQFDDDDLRASATCIVYGPEGCKAKCEKLCKKYKCYAKEPICVGIHCDCHQKFTWLERTLIDPIPPNISFKELLAIRFLKTPIFEKLDTKMQEEPVLKKSVMQFLRTTKLQGKKLKDTFKRTFPKLKSSLKCLKPRPTIKEDEDISMAVIKNGIGKESSKSWLSKLPNWWSKPKEFDVNSEENQQRIISLIKTLKDKKDLLKVLLTLKKSEEKELYINIVKYLMLNGLKIHDGTVVVEPLIDERTLKAKMENDDIIKVLKDKLEQEENENNKYKNDIKNNETKQPSKLFDALVEDEEFSKFWSSKSNDESYNSPNAPSVDKKKEQNQQLDSSSNEDEFDEFEDFWNSKPKTKIDTLLNIPIVDKTIEENQLLDSFGDDDEFWNSKLGDIWNSKPKSKIDSLPNVPVVINKIEQNQQSNSFTGDKPNKFNDSRNSKPKPETNILPNVPLVDKKMEDKQQLDSLGDDDEFWNSKLDDLWNSKSESKTNTLPNVPVVGKKIEQSQQSNSFTGDKPNKFNDFQNTKPKPETDILRNVPLVDKKMEDKQQLDSLGDDDEFSNSKLDDLWNSKPESKTNTLPNVLAADKKLEENQQLDSFGDDEFWNSKLDDLWNSKPESKTNTLPNVLVADKKLEENQQLDSFRDNEEFDEFDDFWNSKININDNNLTLDIPKNILDNLSPLKEENNLQILVNENSPSDTIKKINIPDLTNKLNFLGNDKESESVIIPVENKVKNDMEEQLNKESKKIPANILQNEPEAILKNNENKMNDSKEELQMEHDDKHPSNILVTNSNMKTLSEEYISKEEKAAESEIFIKKEINPTLDIQNSPHEINNDDDDDDDADNFPKKESQPKFEQLQDNAAFQSIKNLFKPKLFTNNDVTFQSIEVSELTKDRSNFPTIGESDENNSQYKKLASDVSAGEEVYSSDESAITVESFNLNIPNTNKKYIDFDYLNEHTDINPKSGISNLTNGFIGENEKRFNKDHSDHFSDVSHLQVKNNISERSISEDKSDFVFPISSPNDLKNINNESPISQINAILKSTEVFNSNESTEKEWDTITSESSDGFTSTYTTPFSTNINLDNNLKDFDIPNNIQELYKNLSNEMIINNPIETTNISSQISENLNEIKEIKESTNKNVKPKIDDTFPKSEIFEKENNLTNTNINENGIYKNIPFSSKDKKINSQEEDTYFNLMNTYTDISTQEVDISELSKNLLFPDLRQEIQDVTTDFEKNGFHNPMFLFKENTEINDNFSEILPSNLNISNLDKIEKIQEKINEEDNLHLSSILPLKDNAIKKIDINEALISDNDVSSRNKFDKTQDVSINSEEENAYFNPVFPYGENIIEETNVGRTLPIHLDSSSLNKSEKIQDVTANSEKGEHDLNSTSSYVDNSTQEIDISKTLLPYLYSSDISNIEHDINISESTINRSKFVSPLEDVSSSLIDSVLLNNESKYISENEFESLNKDILTDTAEIDISENLFNNFSEATENENISEKLILNTSFPPFTNESTIERNYNSETDISLGNETRENEFNISESVQMESNIFNNSDRGSKQNLNDGKKLDTKINDLSFIDDISIFDSIFEETIVPSQGSQYVLEKESIDSKRNNYLQNDLNVDEFDNSAEIFDDSFEKWIADQDITTKPILNSLNISPVNKFSEINHKNEFLDQNQPSKSEESVSVMNKNSHSEDIINNSSNISDERLIIDSKMILESHLINNSKENIAENTNISETEEIKNNSNVIKNLHTDLENEPLQKLRENNTVLNEELNKYVKEPIFNFEDSFFMDDVSIPMLNSANESIDQNQENDTFEKINEVSLADSSIKEIEKTESAPDEEISAEEAVSNNNSFLLNDVSADAKKSDSENYDQEFTLNDNLTGESKEVIINGNEDIKISGTDQDITYTEMMKDALVISDKEIKDDNTAEEAIFNTSLTDYKHEPSFSVQTEKEENTEESIFNNNDASSLDESVLMDHKMNYLKTDTSNKNEDDLTDNTVNFNQNLPTVITMPEPTNFEDTLNEVSNVEIQNKEPVSARDASIESITPFHENDQILKNNFSIENERSTLENELFNHEPTLIDQNESNYVPKNVFASDKSLDSQIQKSTLPSYKNEFVSENENLVKVDEADTDEHFIENMKNIDPILGDSSNITQEKHFLKDEISHMENLVPFFDESSTEILPEKSNISIQENNNLQTSLFEENNEGLKYSEEMFDNSQELIFKPNSSLLVDDISSINSIKKSTQQSNENEKTENAEFIYENDHSLFSNTDIPEIHNFKDIPADFLDTVTHDRNVKEDSEFSTNSFNDLTNYSENLDVLKENFVEIQNEEENLSPDLLKNSNEQVNNSFMTSPTIQGELDNKSSLSNISNTSNEIFNMLDEKVNENKNSNSDTSSNTSLFDTHNNNLNSNEERISNVSEQQKDILNPIFKDLPSEDKKVISNKQNFETDVSNEFQLENISTLDEQKSYSDINASFNNISDVLKENFNQNENDNEFKENLSFENIFNLSEGKENYLTNKTENELNEDEFYGFDSKEERPVDSSWSKKSLFSDKDGNNDSFNNSLNTEESEFNEFEENLSFGNIFNFSEDARNHSKNKNGDKSKNDEFYNFNLEDEKVSSNTFSGEESNSDQKQNDKKSSNEDLTSNSFFNNNLNKDESKFKSVDTNLSFEQFINLSMEEDKLHLLVPTNAEYTNTIEKYTDNTQLEKENLNDRNDSIFDSSTEIDDNFSDFSRDSKNLLSNFPINNDDPLNNNLSNILQEQIISENESNINEKINYSVENIMESINDDFGILNQDANINKFNQSHIYENMLENHEQEINISTNLSKELNKEDSNENVEFLPNPTHIVELLKSSTEDNFVNNDNRNFENPDKIISIENSSNLKKNIDTEIPSNKIFDEKVIEKAFEVVKTDNPTKIPQKPNFFRLFDSDPTVENKINDDSEKRTITKNPIFSFKTNNDVVEPPSQKVKSQLSNRFKLKPTNGNSENKLSENKVVSPLLDTSMKNVPLHTENNVEHAANESVMKESNRNEIATSLSDISDFILKQSSLEEVTDLKNNPISTVGVPTSTSQNMEFDAISDSNLTKSNEDGMIPLLFNSTNNDILKQSVADVTEEKENLKNVPVFINEKQEFDFTDDSVMKELNGSTVVSLPSDLMKNTATKQSHLDSATDHKNNVENISASINQEPEFDFEDNSNMRKSDEFKTISALFDSNNKPALKELSVSATTDKKDVPMLTDQESEFSFEDNSIMKELNENGSFSLLFDSTNKDIDVAEDKKNLKNVPVFINEKQEFDFTDDSVMKELNGSTVVSLPSDLMKNTATKQSHLDSATDHKNNVKNISASINQEPEFDFEDISNITESKKDEVIPLLFDSIDSVVLKPSSFDTATNYENNFENLPPSINQESDFNIENNSNIRKSNEFKATSPLLNSNNDIISKESASATITDQENNFKDVSISINSNSKFDTENDFNTRESKENKTIPSLFDSSSNTILKESFVSSAADKEDDALTSTNQEPEFDFEDDSFMKELNENKSFPSLFDSTKNIFMKSSPHNVPEQVNDFKDISQSTKWNSEFALEDDSFMWDFDCFEISKVQVQGLKKCRYDDQDCSEEKRQIMKYDIDSYQNELMPNLSCMLYGEEGCLDNCYLRSLLYGCEIDSCCYNEIYCDCNEIYIFGDHYVTANDFKTLSLSELWSYWFEESFLSLRILAKIKRNAEMREFTLALLRKPHLIGNEIQKILADEFPQIQNIINLRTVPHGIKNEIITDHSRLEYDILDSYFHDIWEPLRNHIYSKKYKKKFKRRIKTLLLNITNEDELRYIVKQIRMSGNNTLLKYVTSLLRKRGYRFDDDDDCIIVKKKKPKKKKCIKKYKSKHMDSSCSDEESTEEDEETYTRKSKMRNSKKSIAEEIEEEELIELVLINELMNENERVYDTLNPVTKTESKIADNVVRTAEEIEEKAQLSAINTNIAEKLEKEIEQSVGNINFPTTTEFTDETQIKFQQPVVNIDVPTAVYFVEEINENFQQPITNSDISVGMNTVEKIEKKLLQHIIDDDTVVRTNISKEIEKSTNQFPSDIAVPKSLMTTIQNEDFGEQTLKSENFTPTVSQYLSSATTYNGLQNEKFSIKNNILENLEKYRELLNNMDNEDFINNENIHWFYNFNSLFNNIVTNKADGKKTTIGSSMVKTINENNEHPENNTNKNFIVNIISMEDDSNNMNKKVIETITNDNLKPNAENGVESVTNILILDSTNDIEKIQPVNIEGNKIEINNGYNAIIKDVCNEMGHFDIDDASRIIDTITTNNFIDHNTEMLSGSSLERITNNLGQNNLIMTAGLNQYDIADIDKIIDDVTTNNFDDLNTEMLSGNGLERITNNLGQNNLIMTAELNQYDIADINRITDSVATNNFVDLNTEISENGLNIITNNLGQNNLVKMAGMKQYDINDIDRIINTVTTNNFDDLNTEISENGLNIITNNLGQNNLVKMAGMKQYDINDIDRIINTVTTNNFDDLNTEMLSGNGLERITNNLGQNNLIMTAELNQYDIADIDKIIDSVTTNNFVDLNTEMLSENDSKRIINNLEQDNLVMMEGTSQYDIAGIDTATTNNFNDINQNTEMLTRNGLEGITNNLEQDNLIITEDLQFPITEIINTDTDNEYYMITEKHSDDTNYKNIKNYIDANTKTLTENYFNEINQHFTNDNLPTTNTLITNVNSYFPETKETNIDYDSNLIIKNDGQENENLKMINNTEQNFDTLNFQNVKQNQNKNKSVFYLIMDEDENLLYTDSIHNTDDDEILKYTEMLSNYIEQYPLDLIKKIDLKKFGWKK